MGRLANEASSTAASRGTNRSIAGHSGDRKAGRPAPGTTPSRVTSHSGHRGHPIRGHGRPSHLSHPSHPSRPIATFAGSGDMTTRQFSLSDKAGWQIEWTYRCPSSLPVGLLVVEDAASAAVSAALSESGAAGQGDTWLHPDGRSHRLVVISTCSWTMKVMQNP